MAAFKEFLEFEIDVLKESISIHYNNNINIVPDLENTEIINEITRLTINRRIISNIRRLSNGRYTDELVKFMKVIVRNFLEEYLNLKYQIDLNLDIDAELYYIKRCLIRSVIHDAEVEDLIDGWIGSGLSEEDVNNIDFIGNIINDLIRVSINLVKKHYDSDQLIELYNSKIDHYYNSFNNDKYGLRYAGKYELTYISSGLMPRYINLNDIVVTGIYTIPCGDSFKVKLVTDKGIMTINERFELIPDNSYDNIVSRDIEVRYGRSIISYSIDQNRVDKHIIEEVDNNSYTIQIDIPNPSKSNPSHVIKLLNNYYIEDFNYNDQISRCLLFSIDGIMYITKIIDNQPLTTGFEIFILRTA